MTVYSFCRRSVFILDTEEEEFVYQHATVKMSNKGEFLSVILVEVFSVFVRHLTNFCTFHWQVGRAEISTLSMTILIESG